VTATRGEAGESALPARSPEHLAEIRTAELEEALSVLGVREHHWLDYPDGGCADVDPEQAAVRVAAVLEDVRPETVVTFGPDGFTGHPDHRAVSRWTDLALQRGSRRPLLLHAVTTEQDVDWAIAEQFGVYDLGRPRVCRDDEVDVLVRLDGEALDRKVDALLSQVSQTRGLVAALGHERFRAWVAGEAFAPAGCRGSRRSGP
jgi:LmbE family N-acetylglucosaminyl deacetylase